ncbi:MAG: DUF4301 family protein [Bacteroidales bacterium]
MFSQKDIQQLENRGITVDKAEKQMEHFRRGFPFLDITKPATVNDGIIRLESTEVDNLAFVYKIFEGSRVKFVPASGAATRMFKHLYQLLNSAPEEQSELLKDESTNSVNYFFDNIKSFAFYEDLRTELIKRRNDIEDLLNNNDHLTILKALLDNQGLNYGKKPKGLIKFHKYSDGSRTAFEEHLVEGARYARCLNNKVNIHLTVSPEHKKGFQDLLNEVLVKYTNIHEVEFNVEFSEQKHSTDMLAVDMNNEPFRDSNGNLTFRPGGHGALIENLNDIEANLVFIKNIDNVVPDNLKNETVLYKKALAGLLISYQSLIFDYINLLQSSEEINDEIFEEIIDFTINELCILPPKDLDLMNRSKLRSYLIQKLNRPIRVCGMVKNQGEPGGGPFWATNPDGSTSLQIVESSQINFNDKSKKQLVNSSTHFNPVDLVCGITDVDGNKFNLLNFSDPQTGFISTKSIDGKPIKAQELPGLWNGAMSDWITIFVEVPLITFNPVKSVNDLLRDEHQK